MSDEDNPLGWGKLAAFASVDAPMNALLMVVVVYVPPFYAGEMGLGLGLVGMTFGLTKLWDVFTDPVFGHLSDRWETPWGRRRPWLALSVPLLMLGVYQVFVPSASASGLYFAIWMVVFYVGWTLISVSHISWSAELSRSYHERSRIAGVKQGAALIGTLGVMLVAAWFDQQPDASEAERLKAIAIAILIALPVCSGAALWLTPERSHPNVQSNAAEGSFKAILRNRPLRLLLLTNLCLGIASGATAGLFLFFVEEILVLEGWASLILIPLTMSGLLFLPVMMLMTRRIGKHNTLALVALYQMAMSLLFIILPGGSVVTAGIGFTLLGATLAANTFLPQAIMADITDLDAVNSGRKRTGLQISLLQSTSKVAAALAIGISYPLLSLIGFDPAPDAVNSVATLDRFRWLMVALQVVMYAGVFVMMRHFPLDQTEQIRLQTELRARAKS